MEGLQRSAISFRRQGSSGLVWDDKLIAELNSDNKPEQEQPAAGSTEDQKPELRRTKSDGGGGGGRGGARQSTYRTVKVEQAEDPPSPRLSACGFCSVFGRPSSVKTDKRKSGKVKKHK